MNTTTRAALNAYQQVDVDNRVLDATPHQLISMLYSAAIASLRIAKACMENHDLGCKGRAISKAIGIIDEGLKVSLNMEAGGEIAANLSALYDYMSERLLYANLKNDASVLDEIAVLLTGLHEAWDGISEPKPENSTVLVGQGAQGDNRVSQRA